MVETNNRKKLYMHARSIVRFLARILMAVAIGILVIILLIPVILLFVTTQTPLYMTGLILTIVVLLFILVFRATSRIRKFLIFLIGMVLINSIVVITSQFFATTPPIQGSNGKPLPRSVAVMEKVSVNGREQWITIRGKDTSKPVLLYLGIGGPGAGGFPATFTSLSSLEDDFVVVNWDQPGTGKSYDAVDITTINTQLFVDDAAAITNLMRKRFHQDKVYVFGLSWGTILGIKLIQQHPELYHAYVGNGQMVNTVENDRFGYNLAIKIATDTGDVELVNALKQNGAPPYNGEGMALKYALYNNVLFEYMNSPRLELVLLLVPQFAKEYGFIDRINFGRGLYESFTVLYPQLTDLDFTKQAAKLKVPIYFLVGKNDVNAVASIVEEYYSKLDAPKKEIIWSQAGHGATADEIEQALVHHALKDTQKE